MLNKIKLGFSVTFVVIAAILMLGEIMVRFAVGPPAAFLYSKGFTDRQTDWNISYEVDKHLHRTNCVSDKEQRIEKIAVVGDSFTYGQGITNCQDLVSNLNRLFPKKEFVNYGVIGIGLPEYKMILRDFVSDGPYGRLILLIYGNDISQYPLNRSLIGSLADVSSLFALFRKLRRSYLMKKALKGIDDEATQKSDDVKTFNNIQALISSGDKAYFKKIVNPPLAHYKKFRNAFTAVVPYINQKFKPDNVSLVFIPAANTVSTLTRGFIQKSGGEVAPFGMAGSVRELLRAIARENNYQFIDLFEYISASGNDYYFSHDLHWNERGHQFVSEVIAKRQIELDKTKQ